jgi:Cdc6-like AAA superfamily ATPase
MTTQKEIAERNNIHDPITIDKDDIEKRDILERRHLAGRILRRLGEEDCPSVLGIYGGWGTGKTSLLNLMCGLNKVKLPQSKEKKVHVEIIDAWKYEGTGNLLIPIIVKLRELSGVKEFIQAWKVMTKRVVALTGLSLIETALKTASPIGIADIDDLYEKIKGKEDKNYATVLLDWERVVDDMSQEQDAFEIIVGLVNKAQNCDRLILCIDNLDRCTPDNVILLLESIKTVFVCPRLCVGVCNGLRCDRKLHRSKV